MVRFKQLIQAKYEAEKKMPLHCKTAASYVLSDLRKLKTPGKSIKGIGRLTLEERGNIPPKNDKVTSLYKQP
jgi:hypothetical protein